MILLRNLLCEELHPTDIPSVLYHATFRPMVESIKKQGLTPSGNKYVNFDNLEYGVYLGISPDYAISMVEASENNTIPSDWFDDIVVLSVNVSDLDLKKLDRDPNVLPQDDEYNDETPPDDTVHSFIYKDVIHPKSLSII